MTATGLTGKYAWSAWRGDEGTTIASWEIGVEG